MYGLLYGRERRLTALFGVFRRGQFAAWGAIAIGLDERQMMLRDPRNFDFRPLPASPLVGAGVIHSPEVPPRGNGGRPDIGAYQADDEMMWRPGCTFHPTCAV